MTFDVRTVFRTLSDSMLAEFERSAQIPHATGKGSSREETVRSFLHEYLPSRYSVGQGQIIHSANRISQQMDIVIYDGASCPRLLANSEHSIFPLEGIYGVISVKSTLNSHELKDAFLNIASAKELVERKSVTVKKLGGWVGLAAPMPVGVVFAFDADRSLEAIATQAAVLQGQMSDATHAPDVIAVLGKGLIGPRALVRDDFNRLSLPASEERMLVREVRKHTLLRLYLHLLSELNTITLPALSLHDYLHMPELVDGHRVSGHGPHWLPPKDQPMSKTPVLKKLGIVCLRRVIAATTGIAPIPFRVHLTHSIGNVNPDGLPPERLNSTVIEYNPFNRPPLASVGAADDSTQTLNVAYVPMYITIDGRQIAVDMNAIAPEDWESTDFEFDEIFDSRQLNQR